MKIKDILFGLISAVFLAVIISPFASSWPDGLEKIAGDKGFIEKENVKPIFSSPVPGYEFPAIGNEKLATSAAGISGVLIVFIMGYGLGFAIRRRKIK